MFRPTDSFWADPRLATGVALSAISLLVLTVWFAKRPKRSGRGAAAVCLALSVALHGLLIYYVPRLKELGGGNRSGKPANDPGSAALVMATLLPDEPIADASAPEPDDASTPLPVREGPESIPENERESDAAQPADTPAPESTAAQTTAPQTQFFSPIESFLAIPDYGDVIRHWQAPQPDVPIASDQPVDPIDVEKPVENPEPEPQLGMPQTVDGETSMAAGQERMASPVPTASVPGFEVGDFANRFGDNKRLALYQNGGDDSTEAAVAAALQYLAQDQRPDGSWDPIASNAGRETMTLGTDRKGAGKNATTGLTGLALLSLLGSGNTHREGPYADNVRRGLTYLIVNQRPDGSLAGRADLFEANYCHGMAALAMCEAAVMTQDPSAIASAKAAVGYTLATQHPTTGGWRYAKGDPGDLSQLGWQAMVLEAGRAAGANVPDRAFDRIDSFLRSVRGGAGGGLASYRPGDGPSRTMTAEALATRLLIGESIPPGEIREAEDYLLRQLPGIGRDNYYGWYYTSLALHQLQDDAWQSWNEAMKAHLVKRQLPDGSFPTDDEWGGYGGRVYTTSMATLCLEVYYRHQRRITRFAAKPDSTR
jgi:hypothetical protein